MRVLQARGYITSTLVLICLILFLVSTQLRDSPWAVLGGRAALLVLGGWMLIDSLWALRSRKLIKDQGISVVGQLQQVNIAGRWRKPVVEFALRDGQRITVEIPQNANFDRQLAARIHATERAIEVKYNPRNPQEAFIFSSFTVWLGPLIGTVVGLLLCIWAFLPGS